MGKFVDEFRKSGYETVGIDVSYVPSWLLRAVETFALEYPLYNYEGKVDYSNPVFKEILSNCKPNMDLEKIKAPFLCYIFENLNVLPEKREGIKAAISYLKTKFQNEKEEKKVKRKLGYLYGVEGVFEVFSTSNAIYNGDNRVGNIIYSSIWTSVKDRLDEKGLNWDVSELYKELESSGKKYQEKLIELIKNCQTKVQE